MSRTLTNRMALIVGGGIGGPVAAMALQRTGIEAVVHEAYDAPSDYAGLFLNTASNGLQLPDDTVSDVVIHIFAPCFSEVTPPPLPLRDLYFHAESAYSRRIGQFRYLRG